MMKRTIAFVALVAICGSTMLSCRNNKTAEPPTEEIQQQQQTLADSVMAEMNALAEQYWDARSNSFKIQAIELSEKEKMVKPDYLLNPSVANTLVTKFQKINALGIYITDIGVCKAFGISCDNIKEVAAKLAVELNVPFYAEFSTDETPIIEKIKATYSACNKRGELSLFWIMENAIITEINYILAQDPELFFSKISEEQWQMFNTYKQIRRTAIDKLSNYNEDMSLLVEVRNKSRVSASDKERDNKNQSLDSAKQYHISKKDKYIAKRNALLQ